MIKRNGERKLKQKSPTLTSWDNGIETNIVVCGLAQCIFESQIMHQEILPFLLSGIRKRISFLLFVFTNLCLE